jgi:hypothetical protein
MRSIDRLVRSGFNSPASAKPSMARHSGSAAVRSPDRSYRAPAGTNGWLNGLRRSLRGAVPAICRRSVTSTASRTARIVTLHQARSSLTNAAF